MLQRHELSAIMGDLPDQEYSALYFDIKTNGILDPNITTLDNKILDGWHRYKACTSLDIQDQLSFTEYTDNNPQSFVHSKNAVRRHLKTSQRAIRTCLLFEWKSPSDNQYAPPLLGGLSTQELATLAGTGTTTIEQCKKIIRNSKQHLVLEQGESINSVYQSILTKERQQQEYKEAQEFKHKKELEKQKLDTKKEKTKDVNKVIPLKPKTNNTFVQEHRDQQELNLQVEYEQDLADEAFPEDIDEVEKVDEPIIDVSAPTDNNTEKVKHEVQDKGTLSEQEIEEYLATKLIPIEHTSFKFALDLVSSKVKEFQPMTMKQMNLLRKKILNKIHSDKIDVSEFSEKEKYNTEVLYRIVFTLLTEMNNSYQKQYEKAKEDLLKNG